MNDKQSMSGGCMCGAVRFEAVGDHHGVTHCHCHSCRKHNGGPVVTLAGYRRPAFTKTLTRFYSNDR